MQITAVTTGTLRLKPTFLEGSPNHGGPLGLIRRLWRDPHFTQPLPMWAWIVDTGTERVLIDAGARPGAGGGVTRTTFQISPDRTRAPRLSGQLVSDARRVGHCPSNTGAQRRPHEFPRPAGRREKRRAACR
jgi:hypothetical protein